MCGCDSYSSRIFPQLCLHPNSDPLNVARVVCRQLGFKGIIDDIADDNNMNDIDDDNYNINDIINYSIVDNTIAGSSNATNAFDAPFGTMVYGFDLKEVKGPIMYDNMTKYYAVEKANLNRTEYDKKFWKKYKVLLYCCLALEKHHFPAKI